MDFGKIYNLSEIEQIELNIPKLTVSKKLSEKLSQNDKFRLLIGAPAWGIPKFLGKIYPKGTKSNMYLNNYSRLFDSIELNTTFYRMPEVNLIKSWCSQVPDGFKFCPKVPKSISHFGGMKDKILVNTFIESINNFGDKLGTTFLLLSDKFSPNRANELISFLKMIPKGINFAVEFRHKDWFSSPNSIFEFLESREISTVITDVLGRRDVLFPVITSDKVIIRFGGNNLHPSDNYRLEKWVERIIELKQIGVQEVYFFIHHSEKYLCVESANIIIELLNNKGIDTMPKIPILNIEEQLKIL